LEWYVTAIGQTGSSTSNPTGCGLAADESSSFDAGLVTRCTGNRLYALEGGRLVDRSQQLGVRSSGWSWGAVAADFDVDGDTDAAVTNGYVAEYASSVTPPTIKVNGDEVQVTDLPVYRSADADVNALWLAGNGTEFVEVADEVGFGSSAQGRALIGGDIDGDGDIDLVQINDGDQPVEIFVNHTDPAEDEWVGVLDVAAPDAAPGCIGCVVELLGEGGDVEMAAMIAGSGSYSSFAPTVAHFGLSPQRSKVTIRITAPGGGVSEVQATAGQWNSLS
jgi:hypothetical protein